MALPEYKRCKGIGDYGRFVCDVNPNGNPNTYSTYKEGLDLSYLGGFSSQRKVTEELIDTITENLNGKKGEKFIPAYKKDRERVKASLEPVFGIDSEAEEFQAVFRGPGGGYYVHSTRKAEKVAGLELFKITIEDCLDYRRSKRGIPTLIPHPDRNGSLDLVIQSVEKGICDSEDYTQQMVNWYAVAEYRGKDRGKLFPRIVRDINEFLGKIGAPIWEEKRFFIPKKEPKDRRWPVPKKLVLRAG